MEGSVRERPDGRYEARLSYADPNTGRRKRASVYAASRKAAMDKLYEVRDRIEAGAPPRDATRTVGDWLRHWRRHPGRVRSKGDYQGAVRQPVCQAPGNRAFGAIRLDRLRRPT